MHRMRSVNGILPSLFLALVFFIFQAPCAHSAEVSDELIKKGISGDVVNFLGPLCQESLNRRLPAGVTWHATFDRDAKSVTVDFQTAEKSHNSLTVVSLAGEGCMTVQNNVFVTVKACDEEAEWWTSNYKKKGVDVKVADRDKNHIYLGASGNLGVKIYLYQFGNACMQVFRNAEMVKNLKK